MAVLMRFMFIEREKLSILLEHEPCYDHTKQMRYCCQHLLSIEMFEPEYEITGVSKIRLHGTSFGQVQMDLKQTCSVFNDMRI